MLTLDDTEAPMQPRSPRQKSLPWTSSTQSGRDTQRRSRLQWRSGGPTPTCRQACQGTDRPEPMVRGRSRATERTQDGTSSSKLKCSHSNHSRRTLPNRRVKRHRCPMMRLRHRPRRTRHLRVSIFIPTLIDRCFSPSDKISPPHLQHRPNQQRRRRRQRKRPWTSIGTIT